MSLSVTDNLNIIGYYGEMELPLAERKIRIVMANEFSETVQKYFAAVHAVSESKVSKRRRDLLLAALVTSLKNAYLAMWDKYYLAYVYAAGAGGGSAFYGVDAWKSQHSRDFALWITQTARDSPNLSHTMNVTRTEINAICNLGALDAAYRQGKRFKTWKTFGDRQVRPTHQAANGTRIPIDEPFTVGDYKMMFPTDSSLGAGAEEIVNCRCVLEFDDGKSLTNGNQRGIMRTGNRMGATGSANFLDYPVVENAGSVESFKKFAAEQMGISSIRGIELLKNGQIPLEMVRAIALLAEKFGKNFSSIEIVDLKGKIIAATQGSQLQINANFANSPEALAAVLNGWEKSGYIPKGCNNAAYVGRHEFFHLLTQDLISEPKSSILTAVKRVGKNGTVSENAQKNAHELVADLLSAKTLTPKQQALKNKIIEIIEGRSL